LPPQIQPPPNPYGGVPNSQHPITPPGTGGLEPMPAGTSPGQPGFINGKDDPSLRNPGAGSSQPGGGDVIQGTSLTLPSVWGGMGAAEKIDWFNQNNVSVDAMRQNGVTDSEITWMKQNGYAGGPAMGGGGPNPGDFGFATTMPVDPGPGGWQTGGSEPNPYVSNGWVASGSGGTKPGVAGNDKHPSASIPTPEARPTPTSWGRNFAQGGALTRAIQGR